MANQKGETTSIGHFYNRCVDAVNNLFDTMSFWTHSKDVEFVDGKNAETKVGAINGITSDISGEADDIAASIKCVNELNSSLTADNAQKFQFAYDSESGKYGYKAKVEGADTFFPFSGLELHFIEVITSTGTNWTEKINTSSKVKFVVAAYPGGGSPYNLIYSDGTYIDEVQTYIQMDIDIADDYFRLKNTSGKVSSSFWVVYAT